MNVFPSADVRLDRTLVALADPTRRAILERLSQGQARVTELAAPFSISLNSVSKHIRMLERAELVQRRIAGKEHLLSYNPAPLEETALWIESQRALWARRLSALDELLREEDRALARAKRKPQRKRKGGPR